MHNLKVEIYVLLGEIFRIPNPGDSLSSYLEKIAQRRIVGDLG